MPAKPPRFTLHLSACSDFSEPTRNALDELFRDGPRDGLHALVIFTSDMVSFRQPRMIGFLIEDENGFRIAKPFDVPAPALARGAAAAFHVANDPRTEHVESVRRVASSHIHTRIAITHRGGISWSPFQCHASRGGETRYQEELSRSENMQGMVYARGRRSGHDRILDHAVFSPLASAIYEAEMSELPKSQRTGLHRKAVFDVSPDILRGDRFIS